MRRLVVLTAVLTLFAAACGPGEDTPPVETPTPTPAEESPTPDPTPPDEEPGDGEEVTAYFARVDDSGGWVEPETHVLDEPTVGVARAALTVAVEGPPRNPDLATAAPEGTTVLDVNISDGVLTIDLSEELRATGAGSAQELAFSQQLAHTAAQFDTVEAVLLWVEGEPVDELWGHLDWSDPIEPDPWALTPVTIEYPSWGETVAQGPVTAGGQANTFEATVELRLIDPDDEVVEDTFTTATSGMGERGTWEHTFEAPLDRPGVWTIEGREPDPSDGEGRPPLVTRVQFEVT